LGRRSVQVIDISSGEVVTIIPAFNEELSIGSVVLGAKEFSNQVLVVDDGSRDRTAALAAMAGAEVIRLPANTGKANALMTGFRQASLTGFDAFVTLDADGQHDPRDIGRVVTPVLEGKADLVIGSRFLDGKGGIPPHRKAGQKVLNGLTNFACERKITDSQSGFRALSRRAVHNMDFESERYNVESDMIYHFLGRGLCVREVPISANYEVPNGHKENPIVHGVAVMGRIIMLISQSRPLLLLGVPGFLMMLLGIIFGGLSFLEVTFFEWGWLFQTLLGVFLFTVGLVMCIAAMVLNSILDLMHRLRNESFRKPEERSIIMEGHH
jgi:glycosyltransferase involved in cell wall biosynthesis